MSLILDIKGWFYSWICVIPKFIYLICMSFCSLLDAFQLMLRKLAGLDTYYVEGVSQTGDVALSFIKSLFESNSRFPAIKNAFWALVVFAVLLLIVVTIIAIIRQEYTKGKADNNKIAIIGQCLKSLFLFFIVPISCIFGLMLSDILLQALDSATSGGEIGGTLFSVEGVKSNLVGTQTTSGSVSYTYFDIFGYGEVTTTTTFSGVMFKTAAYSSNRARRNKDFNGLTFVDRVRNGSLTNFGIFNLASSDEECAQMIDDAFANCVKLNSSNNKIVLGEMESLAGSGLWSINEGSEIEHMSKFNVSLVWYYYDLWNFNFLIGFAFIIIGIKLLFNIVIGLMKRIVEMAALFVVSPPLVATMPLDDGKAYQKWRESFLSKALSAYGAIIGMNLIFLILNRINLFSDNFQFLNGLASSLFIIAGLMTVEGFIELMSKMVGADNIYKSGTEVSKQVGDSAAKAGKLAASAVGVVASVYVGGAKLALKGLAKTKMGKSLMDKFSNVKSNMFVTKKEQQKAQEDAVDSWEKGEGDKQYQERMEASETYQKSMDEAWKHYRKHWKSNKTKEEWLKSESGRKAKENAEKAYAKETGVTREDFIQNSQERQTYIHNQTKANKKAYQTARTRKIGGKISKVTNGMLKTTGAQRAISLGGQYLDLIKGTMVTGGKGGFKAMQMAFTGRTQSEIEAAATEKSIRKEEEQRQKARMDAANKK